MGKFDFLEVGEAAGWVAGYVAYHQYTNPYGGDADLHGVAHRTGDRTLELTGPVRDTAEQARRDADPDDGVAVLLTDPGPWSQHWLNLDEDPGNPVGYAVLAGVGKPDVRLSRGRVYHFRADAARVVGGGRLVELRSVGGAS